MPEEKWDKGLGRVGKEEIYFRKKNPSQRKENNISNEELIAFKRG